MTHPTERTKQLEQCVVGQFKSMYIRTPQLGKMGAPRIDRERDTWTCGAEETCINNCPSKTVQEA